MCVCVCVRVNSIYTEPGAFGDCHFMHSSDEEVLVWLVPLLYAHLQHHDDAIIKTDAVIIKTQEDFFNNIYLSLYL